MLSELIVSVNMDVTVILLNGSSPLRRGQEGSPNGLQLAQRDLAAWPVHPDAVRGHGRKRGEFQIFDTYDITKGPICKIELPFHMGWTPHGHWMDFRS